MAKQSVSTSLSVTDREPGHSRATRRLRREGRIPGVIYGRGADPQPFSVDARDLRLALAASGAVLDVDFGGASTPAVLKDLTRDPVRGDFVHVDLLRVDLTQTIQTTVPLHLVGADHAPGVTEGGILEQTLRELNVEALPNEIPEYIEHDVSGMELMATEHLSAVTVPDGVTLLDDPDETVIATITPPRGTEEADEGIEEETGIVGEGEGEAEGSAEDADAGDVPADAGDAGGE